MTFKKLSAFLMILILAFCPLSFAGFVVQEDGVQEGIVEKLNVSTGLNVSVSGKTGTVTSESADGNYSGNVTFQSTLTANGRASGASTMSSSSTFLSAAGIAYAVINKRIGGGGGLDGQGWGSLMPDGKNGQRLTFLITASQGGNWVLTSQGNGWNWNNATFNAVDDMLTMDFITGLGWIIDSYESVTFTRNQLP